MEVKYKKFYGIGLTTIGSATLILNLMVQNYVVALLSGTLSIVAGIAFLRRSYFVLEENRIVINALLGPASRDFNFGSYADLVVDEREHVFIKHDGVTAKIPLSKAMSNPEQWSAFIARIRKG